MDFGQIVPHIITALSSGGFVAVISAWYHRKIVSRKGLAEARNIEVDVEIKLSKGYRELYEEARKKVQVHERRIEELESLRQNKLTLKDFQMLLDIEQEYHKELVRLIYENRDLREQIIFSSLLKDHG